MAPKGLQFEPQGHQNEPKGCQRDAKSEPKINKNTTKGDYLEKGRRRGVKCSKFWLIFESSLVKKMHLKIDAKNDARKSFKNTKHKQKTRYEFILRK